MAKINRLQFDVNDEQLAELDALKRRRGAKNRATVVRDALRLFWFYLDKTSKGVTFQMVDPDGTVKRFELEDSE